MSPPKKKIELINIYKSFRHITRHIYENNKD